MAVEEPEGWTGVKPGDGGSRPVPDPTSLTTEQLLRAITAERDYVKGQLQVLEERLSGIDRATELRLRDIVGIPKQIEEKVAHLASLMDVRFDSIETQFKERDVRSERESRDNKVAVDAAFAAQKEAASEQNKSNTLAITKSEVATTETINKLAELFRTTTDGLRDMIDDLKERLSRTEAIKQGVAEFKGETRAVTSNIGVVIGMVAAVIAIIVTLYATRSHTSPPTPQVVTVTTPSTP